jgi:hypothetical protein
VKRLVAFLLLLGLGIVALRFAIGDELLGPGANAATNGQATDQPSSRTTDQTRPEPERSSTGGVQIRQGNLGGTLSGSGQTHFVKWRNIDEGGGRIRKEEAFVLDAADSKPVGEGLQQLDRIVVRVFDEGKHVATVNSRQAFVQLRPDATGTPSFDESKDLDLRDVVLTGEPGGRFAGLRLELGDAKVVIADDAIDLTTTTQQPVRITMAGERDVTLRGRGAIAHLPRTRDAADTGAADVQILSEPVLETDGLVATARGKLHFREDVATGTSRVTLDQQVELELADGQLQWATPGRRSDETASDATAKARPATGRPATGPAKARGDRFVGWLVRSRTTDADGRQRRSAQWRQLVLTGAPAVVELAEARLTTPRLTALPGLFGEPFLITAHGGESRFEQLMLRPGSKQKELTTGSAAQRLHLARPGQLAGAAHSSFGFPRWSLRALDELQVVVGEGAARLDSGRRTIVASDGVRIIGRDGGDKGDAATVRGFGTVAFTDRAETAKDEELVATGSDGFVGFSTPRGERLVLGPVPDPSRPGATKPHEFDVRHGDARLHGLGTCTVERDYVAGDPEELPATTGQPAGSKPRRVEHTRLVVHSPDASVIVQEPSQGLELRGVHRLTAELVATDSDDGKPGRPTLQALDAAGWPLAVRIDGKDETAQARAPRVVQIGPASFRLLPPDDATPAMWSRLAAKDRLPTLHRTGAGNDRIGAQAVDLHGPQIDLHHVGGRAVMIDAVAVGDEQPHVFARIAPVDGEATREATTIATSAQRLRLLPFLVSPGARRWHSFAAGGVLADVMCHIAGSAWLVADRVDSFELDDHEQGHVTGSGHRLLISEGARTALFVGDPDQLVPARIERRHEGRVAMLQGARVRYFDAGDDDRLQALGSFAHRSTFLAPTITLHDPGRTGLLAHMRATCRGNIEVRRADVEFSGPVVTQGLRADGSDDPDGPRIDARELAMKRDPKTGALVEMTAEDVTIDWTRLDARCAEVTLDLVRSRCIAKDRREAVITLGSGLEVRAPRIEVDWESMAVQAAGARFAQRALGEARK